jgi:hypothetical protein
MRQAGGEEFGLFTRKTNRLQATQVAAELIARVNPAACSSAAFHQHRHRVHGWADRAERSLRLADQAMYQAKLAGKNRFVLALPAELAPVRSKPSKPGKQQKPPAGGFRSQFGLRRRSPDWGQITLGLLQRHPRRRA